MKSKKAWLRILEAFIAIILITSVLLILNIRTINKPKQAEEVYKLQNTILEEIASDSYYRNAVLGNDTVTIEDFVSERVPQGFEFGIKICEIKDICKLDVYMGEEGEDIYSSERIISTTITQTSLNPKKLKIFMWRA